MSEEMKNEKEEKESEIVSEASETAESTGALFENEIASSPKKGKRISLHTAIFAAIALTLAAVMTTYTCLSGVYRQRLAEVQKSQTVMGDERYYPFELFDQIFSQMSFQELNEEEMMAAALKAYVYATGDAYAAYYTAEEYTAMMNDNAGKAQGIGINVSYGTIEYEGAERDVIQIFHVTENSPAQKADIQPGDVIYAIGENGSEGTVDALGYDAALQKLQGEKGTTAAFTILRREGGVWSTPKTRQVIREEFTSDSVYGFRSGIHENVGIIRIIQFDLNTPKQFSKVLDQLKAQGCESFVFDLRNNLGGALQSIEAILSYFLSEGDVLIRVKDKAGNEEVSKVKATVYSGDYEGCNVLPTDIGKYKGLRSVVLCNGSTASAAELFTATFRDYGLGTIVGTKTFGKGSMQSILPLTQYGYTGALKLTTAMYFSAKDLQGYDGVGIFPDHVVELEGERSIYIREESEDNQLMKALGILNPS